MSVFSQLMMKNKNIEPYPYPPDNVVFYTSQDRMTLRDGGSSNIYYKKNDGLVYVGYFVYEYEGNMWQAPMFVSENRNACFYNRDHVYDNTVSETTFKYKGKDWYWVIRAHAIGASNITTSADYYRIGGADFVFTGTIEEIYLNSAKALLDYVYSFPSPLPSAYSQLEYIQSSGTQYIDTGIFPNKNTKVEIDYILTESATQAIISSNESDGNSAFKIVSVACKFGNTAKPISIGTVGTYYNIEMSKDGVYNGDSKIANFSGYSFSAQSTKSLYLFANNNNGTADTFSKMKLYRCRIYDNDVLVREYIPAIRKSNDEIGLYDIISGQFFTNTGTGNFIGA